MQLTELYYFHALINHAFFNGELEAVILREFESQDDIVAKLETNLEPFIIWFDKSHLEEADDVFIITVLFHEMIHQFCKEHGIEDVDADGTHLDVFKVIAREHGLTHNGYGLSTSVEEFIKKHLERYEEFHKFEYI